MRVYCLCGCAHARECMLPHQPPTHPAVPRMRIPSVSAHLAVVQSPRHVRMPAADTLTDTRWRPGQMKALVYHAYDDLQIEDVPIPEIGDGELLLRVAGCGLCGSDVLKIQQRAPAPVKLGHELTGVIARIKPQARDETGLREGQRVVIAHHLACGVCHYCRHGNDSLCPQ